MEPFARTIDAAKEYVVSSTLERVDWNAELVRGDLGKAVQQPKRESGKRRASRRARPWPRVDHSAEPHWLAGGPVEMVVILVVSALESQLECDKSSGHI